MAQPSRSQTQISDVERGSDSRKNGKPQGSLDKLRASYARLFDIESKWGRDLYIAAYMIIVIMHPFHYYSYVIDFGSNCLKIDNRSYATVAVILFFNAYMLLYTPNFLKNFFDTRSSKTTTLHFFFTQIPVLLMTLTILPDLTTGTTDKIFLITANLFLFGYILLVIGLSMTIKNATEGSYIAETKWAKAGFNLFLYLLGGHVFGALWYSFAVDRILACWREDYFSRNKFNPQSFLCRDVRDTQKKLGGLFCPKIGSAIKWFGIFEDALLSQIVELKIRFLKKFLYCLRWGLQTLSCFGQNLTPSTFIMENIFVVSITVYSLVLFVFFIGNVQTYVAPQEKLKKETVKQQCKSFNKLSEQLQKEVMESSQLKKWPETKTFHIDALFNILHDQDLLEKIKTELCLPQLKKVEKFENWSESTLKHLLDRVKPVFYSERTRIVREGDPIDEMFFVLQGKLWTYTSMDHFESENYYLKDGDFFGEELVSWARGDPPSASLPIYTRSVKALTNVEAFVLMADDLKEVIQHKLELVLRNHSHVSSQQQRGLEIIVREQ